MDQNNGRLEIITFGSFDILIDGDSLFDSVWKKSKSTFAIEIFYI